MRNRLTRMLTNMGIVSTRLTIASFALASAVANMLAAGPQTAKPSHPLQTPTAKWLEFDTDSCGQLSRLRNNHSAARGFSAADPYAWDDDDEDDWVNAWNMSPEESQILNDWMSQHPEIATVTSAVEKACDDEETPMDDSDEVEIA